MSTIPIPPRPSGSGADSRWYQFVHDYIVHSSGVNQAPGVAIDRTTRGTMVRPIATDGGSGTAKMEKLILADASQDDYLICRPWNEDYWNARRDLRTLNSAVPTNQQIADQMEIELSELTAYLALEVLVAKVPDHRAADMDQTIVDVVSESWNGTTLSTTTTTYFFDYKSATFRIKYDVPFAFDPQTQTVATEATASEEQTIIPRFVAEETIIHAGTSNRVELTVDGSSLRRVDLNLAGRAWAVVA